MDRIYDVLCRICGFLQGLLDDAYGEGLESRAETVPIGTAPEWTAVVVASRPSLLQLYNPNAAPIFISLTGRDLIGGQYPATSFTVWDRFEGTLYARGPAGSTINFLIAPRRLR